MTIHLKSTEEMAFAVGKKFGRNEVPYEANGATHISTRLLSLFTFRGASSRSILGVRASDQWMLQDYNSEFKDATRLLDHNGMKGKGTRLFRQKAALRQRRGLSTF